MAQFNKIVIYYFSGTGNSKNVARWISETAAKQNIACDIYNIALIDRINIPLPDTNALIIFISPVHGFNYPPIMVGFISRYPKGKNKVVLMNTRAGLLVGKFNLPGLTGVSFLFASLILRIKGYSISGMVPFDLPSNWIFLHPGLNASTIKILHSKNKERVVSSAGKILAGNKDFRALREIVLDVAISPISLGYYFVGRFIFAKTFYTTKDCSDCEVCINKCPVKAIIKVDKRPFWTFRCESCMNCISICPKKSIQAAHGFIAGTLLFASFFTGLFFKYYNHFIKIENTILSETLKILLTLLTIGIAYRITHYLMRFKFFEKIMVYTSFTRYKFWGRSYKALENF